MKFDFKVILHHLARSIQCMESLRIHPNIVQILGELLRIHPNIVQILGTAEDCCVFAMGWQGSRWLATA